MNLFRRNFRYSTDDINAILDHPNWSQPGKKRAVTSQGQSVLEDLLEDRGVSKTATTKQPPIPGGAKKAPPALAPPPPKKTGPPKPTKAQRAKT